MARKHGALNIGQHGVVKTDDALEHFFALAQDFDEVVTEFFFDGFGLITGSLELAEGLNIWLHKNGVRMKKNKNAK